MSRINQSGPSSADFALLCRVIRGVTRSRRLSPEDADDFSQSVHLKLLERNYDVFSAFEGRSSMATYLTVVVSRLLLDWRNSMQGKWRPSAGAVRLGPEAVALERLIARDGHTTGEAIQIVRQRYPACTVGALEELAAQLPARHRRAMLPDACLDELGHAEFSDPVLAAETQRAQRAQRTALARACRELSDEDRRLIALRYGRALSVRAIGARLATDPKPLYRRLERSLKTLRRSLDRLGVEAAGSRANP